VPKATKLFYGIPIDTRFDLICNWKKCYSNARWIPILKYSNGLITGLPLGHCDTHKDLASFEDIFDIESFKAIQFQHLKLGHGIPVYEETIMEMKDVSHILHGNS